MKKIKIVLAALLTTTFMLPVQSAQAADKACVYLVPGAGYAAKVRVKTDEVTGEWSHVFAVGQSRCVSLEGLPADVIYTVEVHAIAGNTARCNPLLKTDKTRPFKEESITFLAYGTTLNHTCTMPR